MNTGLYSTYLGVYIAAITAVGIYHAVKVKTMDDYLVAGRRTGFWHTVASMVATACGSATFIGFVGMGYSSGINGIFFWILPAVFFGLFFSLLFSPVIIKLRQYTIPDVFALRFGRSAAIVPAVMQVVVYSVPVLAIQFIGMGTVFSTFLGMDLSTGILLGFVVVTAAALFGGMPTVIVTDVLQAIILTIGILVLFAFTLQYVGGIEQVLHTTPASYWNPLGATGWETFASLALTVGPFYLVWQTTWQRAFAAKNERTAKSGLTWGIIVAAAVSCVSFLSGIAIRAALPHDIAPDLVFTTAVSTVLPTVLGGLVILGLASAIMSGADSFILMGSASIARDLYQRFLKPDASPKQMLRISRLSAVLLCTGSLIVALSSRGIVPLLILITKTMGASTVIPFLALMFWKRATRKGIIAGTSVGCVTTLGWYLAGNPFVMEAIVGYTSCLITTVTVSLTTSHAPDEQPKAVYFDDLQTPPILTSRKVP